MIKYIEYCCYLVCGLVLLFGFPINPFEANEDYTCTAFFINQYGTLATAKHCASAKYYSFRYNNTWHQAFLIGKDSLHDIALFRTDIIETSFLPLEKADLEAYQVAIYGYPRPEVKGLSLKVTYGTSSYLWVNNSEMSNAVICPGNSGGPEINQYGNVIGVVVNGYDAWIFDKNGCTTKSGAVPSKYLIDLAERFYIPIEIKTNGYLEPLNSHYDPNMIVLLYGMN